MPDVTARPYTASDREACLSLFDGNVPRFFLPEEREAFVEFLDLHASRWTYQVLVQDGGIVACGGHLLTQDGTTAMLAWGMVDRKRHGTGLGTLLTTARIDAARACPTVRRVCLDTSQHTGAFYQRFGFVVDTVIRDGYGPGLSRWNMTLTFEAQEQRPPLGSRASLTRHPGA